MQEVAFSKNHILRPKKEIEVFSERSKSAAEPLISGHVKEPRIFDSINEVHGYLTNISK